MEANQGSRKKLLGNEVGKITISESSQMTKKYLELGVVQGKTLEPGRNYQNRKKGLQILCINENTNFQFHLPFPQTPTAHSSIPLLLLFHLSAPSPLLFCWQIFIHLFRLGLTVLTVSLLSVPHSGRTCHCFFSVTGHHSYFCVSAHILSS